MKPLYVSMRENDKDLGSGVRKYPHVLIPVHKDMSFSAACDKVCKIIPLISLSSFE
jgi:hypothetical protein